MTTWRESRRLRRIFFVLAAVYAAGVVAAASWLHLLSDRYATDAFLLYGPRWPGLVPGVALAFIGVALRAWSGAALSAAATLVAFFAYLDFQLPTPFSSDEGASLRIVTYNILERDLTGPWLAQLLEEQAPDVLALVECRPPDPFTPPDPSYHYGKSYGLCLLSRFPIVDTDARDQRDAFARGGKAAITRFTLEPPDGARFDVMVIHLESPRGAIESLLHDRLDGFAGARENLALRVWEAGLAREWLDRTDHPTVVVGDFNLTEESSIYQTHFGHLENAFSRCGFGFGNTKKTRWFGARIDHILTTAGFTCSDASVVDFSGSDHVPLAATLRRPSE